MSEKPAVVSEELMKRALDLIDLTDAERKTFEEIMRGEVPEGMTKDSALASLDETIRKLLKKRFELKPPH